MKKLLVCFSVAIFMSAGISRAATDDGAFVVRGYGGQSCSDLISSLGGDQKDINFLRFSEWLSGWLSSANRFQSGYYDVFPVSEIGGTSNIVLRVCSKNPDSLIEDVLHSVVSAAIAGASTTSSSITNIQHEGNKVRLRAEVLLKVQNRLVSLGLLEEKMADGKFGNATKNALLSFQGSRGLRLTGIPDAFTTYMLFLD